MKQLLKVLKIEKKIYYILLKSELNIENEDEILSQSDLNECFSRKSSIIRRSISKNQKKLKNKESLWFSKS